MIDGVQGITAQDAHVAGFILDEWASVVVLINKWDAVEKDSDTMARRRWLCRLQDGDASPPANSTGWCATR
jgi:predicted GTPase